MSEWQAQTWGDVCVLKYGKSLKNYKNSEGTTLVFGSSGVVGRTSEAPLSHGPKPILGRKGTLGVHLADGPFWAIDTAFWLEPSAMLNPRWAYYYLQTIDWNRLQSGSSLPSLSRDHFYANKLLLPSIHEQEQIANVLGAFDDLIDLNLRIASNLSSISSAAYAAKTTHLPRVPLGDVIGLAYGKSLTTRKRIPGNVPVVSSAGVSGSHNKSLVDGPGVVLGRKGTIGSVTWVRENFYPIDTTFYATSSLPMEIVFEMLEAAKLSELNSDSAVPGLNRNRALAQEVADVRGEPTLRLAPLLSTVRFVHDQLLDEAAEVRAKQNELLPLLISGKVQVRDLERVT